MGKLALRRGSRAPCEGGLNLAGFSRILPLLGVAGAGVCAAGADEDGSGAPADLGVLDEARHTCWTMPVPLLLDEAIAVVKFVELAAFLVIVRRRDSCVANVRCWCQRGPRRGNRNRGIVAIVTHMGCCVLRVGCFVAPESWGDERTVLEKKALSVPVAPIIPEIGCVACRLSHRAIFRNKTDAYVTFGLWLLLPVKYRRRQSIVGRRHIQLRTRFSF